MSALLTEGQMAEFLKDNSGWAHKDNALVQKFKFGKYMDGIRFVELVAIEAEAEDHHPDLLVRYAEVVAFLSTHSAGGVTPRDAELARAIDRIYGTLTA
jgi:4a-hydroxytetrahydrobiopterin dehydratase